MKLERTFLLIGLSVLLASCAEQSPSANSSDQKPASVVETPPQSSVRSSAISASRVSPVEKKIQPGNITGVEMGRVFTMQQAGQLLLVDCRPPIFYRLGHLDGAINLPLKSYDALIDRRKQSIDNALAAGQTIVLYCQNTECPDAYAVAKKLITRGYSVSIYKGGWEEWKRAGF